MVKMYELNPQFGYQIYGRTIGECWISLVEAISTHGESYSDEDRKRKALFDVRLRSETQVSPDTIIHRYGNQDGLQTILRLTFSEPEMYDTDITPSFRRGPKSYFQRIKEGNMFEFIVSRLTEIPESKKAVFVFPTYEDYKAILQNPRDDYLPCLTSVQFRLRNENGEYRLNTNCNFRSLDAYQKGHGNLEAIALMTKSLAEQIAERKVGNRNPINPGYLDMMIADAHIYENTLEDARKMLDKYKGELK